jgi:hypothetical protein
VEQVTESGIVVLNERLKANRQTGGEAFLYRNCLRSARLIAETRCAKGLKQWPNTRRPNKRPGRRPLGYAHCDSRAMLLTEQDLKI